MMGGWGNGWGNNVANATPYAISADVQRGFDQANTNAGISALQAQIGNGFADNAVAQCQGNANIVQAITNSQFGTAQAITGAKDTLALGLNQLAIANQQGFYDNKSGVADLKYTVATEACNDRNTINLGVRDLLANQTANTQAIIQSQQQGFQGIQDKLCQLELDSYKQKVSDQAAEIASLRGQVSQTAQTASIIANNEAQTANLLQRLNPAPIPAYPVANPNCCGNVNFGCGCGA